VLSSIGFGARKNTLENQDLIIGGYRRLSVMQTGQNSEVWKVAELGNSNRVVAMKLLLPERERDANQIRLLRHEYRIGKQLQHPKIIRIEKMGWDKHILFVIMEYFAAPNIKTRMQAKEFERFLKPHMRSILEQSAAALEYMHSKKWVHRDIKPENVLVDATGDVRLIDFALAVRSASALAKRFGRRGVTAGTRSYMSPEQIRGYPVDVRADIYSFGVMAYELVAGRLPFVGTTSSELLRKHIFEQPPPIDSSRKVTPEFEQILKRLLAKKEADRFQSMQEFLSRLKAVKIFTDEEVGARNTLAPSNR
jgi:serine/threonine protein kinase